MSYRGPGRVPRAPRVALAYLIVRALIGSSVGALAITDAVPSTWLLIVGIARRRIDPIAVLSATTVMIALAAYAITGGDPLAIKLRRGAGHRHDQCRRAGLGGTRPSPPAADRGEHRQAEPGPSGVAARLAKPERRRVVTMLTANIGATFAVDGASQIVLALIVPTGTFVAHSTGARIAVFGTGLVITIQYLRGQKSG